MWPKEIMKGNIIRHFTPNLTGELIRFVYINIPRDECIIIGVHKRMTSGDYSK